MNLKNQTNKHLKGHIQAKYKSIEAVQIPQIKPILPSPHAAVTIKDNFWSKRINTNHSITIPYVIQKCEETGRIRNFDKAAGALKGDFEGFFYNDSDVYKTIEGVAYSLNISRDPNLEAYIDTLTHKISAAQWENGYLNTYFSIPHRRPNEILQNHPLEHDLYCMGHLFEAAVAYYQATGKPLLLATALKLANYLTDILSSQTIRLVPGHPEIEIGLVKLYQITGNTKYLMLADFLIRERGNDSKRNLLGEWCQDHKPLSEQKEIVGHAVRALYLYTGMADVSLSTGNRGYLDILSHLWKDMVQGKMYITGGIGTRHKTEDIGRAYELPNKTAYNETCAAVANIFWNHRMFLATKNSCYMDILERILYNAFLVSISLNGDSFFYANPLEADGRYKFNFGKATRQAWFDCACCPTNVVRFLPALGQYLYTLDENNVYVNLFVANQYIPSIQKIPVSINLKSNYPWDGQVQIEIQCPEPVDFSLNIRIPGWARGFPFPSDLYLYLKPDLCPIPIKLNGESITSEMRQGYACIKRLWNNNDTVVLDFPMPVQRVICHPNVTENQGKIALERGPLVYCFEDVDNSLPVTEVCVGDADNLHIFHRKDLLGGIVTIEGQTGNKSSQRFTAIPYYCWLHRGESAASVWIHRKT